MRHTRLLRALPVLPLLLLAAGCDGESTSDPDGGAPDAGPIGILVAPAAPPALPCPEGWSARSVEGVAAEACEPWALGADPRCSAGEARFVGDPACAPIGGACPSGPWPDDLPASGVIYVDAAAAPGGDGAAPASAFATVSEGLAAASAGDVVAVAAGEYVEAVRVPAGVILRGACPARTRLRSPSRSTTATVELAGAGATLERVSVGGADRPGVAARSGASGVIRDVEVSGAEGIGVWVTSASLEATRLVVRDVAPIPDGRFGQGVVVEFGATFTATDLAILDVTENALAVSEPTSTASVTGLLAIGTRARPADDLGGFGVRVYAGASVTVREALIEDNVQASVFVRDDGSSLALEDAVVRATRPGPFVGEPALGRGVAVEDRSTVTLRRVLLEQHYDAALRGSGGATIDAEDVIIADVEPETWDGSDGIGVVAQSGATARLTRVAIARAHTSGIDAVDPGTAVEATDVSVSDTRARPTDGAGGRGVAASFEAVLTGTRVHVEGCRDIGVAVLDGAEAILRDLTVVDTVGRGLEANRGSAVTLTNASLRGSQEAGLVASGAETRVTVSSVSFVGGAITIDDTGRAMHAQLGASIEGGVVDIRDNAEIGLVSVGDARVSLEDVSIRNVRRRDCAETTCPGFGLGYGAVAFLGGQLTLRGFDIEGCALAGVVIGAGGGGSFSDGRIARQPIGVNIRDDAVEFGETFVDVAFDDNDRNVDAQSLPLPEPEL